MDHPYVRDPHSKAIINTNTEAIHQRKQYKLLKMRLSKLEHEMEQMKLLLQTLIPARG